MNHATSASSALPAAPGAAACLARRRGRRAALALLLLLLAALGGLACALVAGEQPVSWRTLATALGPGASQDMAVQVVRSLRLPRALGAFACGGLLALAGALMQVLLRNPLADPYVLGVSGGAAVGALAAISAGLATLWVNSFAFLGALAAMLLVFGLARGEGAWTHTRLLLTGVIVASGCGAAISLMLAMSTDSRLQNMLFWLMGDASGIGRPWPALLVLACGLAGVLPWARDLNLLTRGEITARALGVRTAGLRIGIYLLASLLTATAVTLVGSVAFVGLIVPHLVRLALGNDQRLLLPAAAVAGGVLLCVADTAARTAMAPVQLPVGVVTALIGVPVFLFLLARHPR